MPDLPDRLCSGCSACCQICPKRCIAMKCDDEGFWKPYVDAGLCIDCKSCEKVCPVLNPYPSKEPLDVYAARVEDDSQLAGSTSGAIFPHLAREIIQEGGVVFGARFDPDWRVLVDCTGTLEGLEAFRGSKYVQAWAGESYIKARSFLRQGRKVLFSGTPCQIAGLKRFLGKDDYNLFTVSLLCHGVPSQRLWLRYLEEEKARQVRKLRKSGKDIPGLELAHVTFRDKRGGWKVSNLSFDLVHNGEVAHTYISADSLYIKAFLKNLSLRESCYACPFKEGRDWADITIGDYWGIEELHPELYDNKGISLVQVKSEQGRRLLKLDGLSYLKTSYEEVRDTNTVRQPPSRPSKRDRSCKRLEKSRHVLRELYRLCHRPSKRWRWALDWVMAVVSGKPVKDRGLH